MRLQDYKYANCKLFRMPSVDVSVVDKKLEQTIVEAWKNGSQAQQTVDSLMQNSEVLDQLSGQIAQNVEFQKQHALSNSEMEYGERVKAHEEVCSGKINELEETVGVQTEEQKSKLTQISHSLQEKQQGYTAAQAQLEEMRARIKKKLGDLGGKQAFEKLINIKETLQKSQQPVNADTTSTTNYTPQTPSTIPAPQTPGYQPQTPNTEPQTNTHPTPGNVPTPNQEKPKSSKFKDLEGALNTVESDGPIDPLNKKTKEYEAVKEAKLEEKKGLIKRFFSKTWEILNYKIW